MVLGTGYVREAMIRNMTLASISSKFCIELGPAQPQLVLVDSRLTNTGCQCSYIEWTYSSGV